MYTSFYNLDKKPFEKNPDPSFLWLGAKHKEALATLENGILENSGFLLLTGDAGSGKTILLKTFVQSLGKDVEWAILSDPRVERIDFYNAIAREFGIHQSFTSKVQFLLQFSHFLHKADDENKKVLLMVDDCHLLSQEMLEELRLLSNIEKADVKLINIFFVGQPVFKDMVSLPRNRAIKQRLTLRNELDSLDVSETHDYISYRLKVAGRDGALFSAKAVEAVHRFSQGIAERINTICAHALVSGAAQAIRNIDNRVIEGCVQQMDIPDNFHQGVDEKLSGGKVNFYDSDELFDSKSSEEALSCLGNVVENEKQRHWLKYGVGFFVLLVVGGYFWFQASRSLERDQEEVAVEIADVPLVKSVSRVNSSPAVAMFEENKSEINGKKATEIKNAILEKTYNSNGQAGEATKLRADQVLAEEAVVEEAAVEEVVVAEAVVEEAVAEEAVVEPKVSVQSDELQANIVPEESAVAPVETMAPLEPRKLVLGLRPNSLKLTSAGEKELDSFIEKLKLYPRAIVHVKGFVSSKSNSPENIKLSRDRAQSVQKFMLEKGIEAGQIEVVGMGNQDPIASNDTSEGRRKNRRVEVIVIDDGT